MKENNTYNEELGGKNLPDSLRVNPFAIPNNFFAEQENQILHQIMLESLRDFNENNESNATGATLPEGYFDTLENNIFAKIAEQDLKEKMSDSDFTVPDQYFEQFGQAIEGRIAEDNLKSFSPTLEYQVPEDYFAKAEEGIFAKIAAQDLRDKIGENSGFTIPTEYFAQATAEIEDRILIEKWSTQFGKDHFSVPTSYFDQLSDRILAKTVGENQEKGQVITLPTRTVWKKYAAAAVAVLVASGAYFGLQNTNSNTQVQQQLASSDVNLKNISDEELLSYLAQVSEGEDLIQLAKFASDVVIDDKNTQLDSNIDDDEIEDYLNYML
jgi:hypothetical protein